MVSITRPTMYAVGASAVSAAIAAVSGIGFAAWVAEDNSITWPAEEMSRAAVYPANHFLYGDALAVGFGASCALVALAIVATVAFARRWAQPHALLLVWLAVSIGVAAPVSVRYSIVLGSPIFLSTVAALIVLLARSSHHWAMPEPSDTSVALSRR